MYHKFKNGSTKKIGYDGLEYHIHFPPVGSLYNYFTGRLEKRPVFNSDKPKKEQKWYPTELPEGWKKKRKEEKKKQQYNPEHFDEELQKFRDQEFDRIINGIWIRIYNPTEKKSHDLYLTGLNYFFLNWWQLGEGYAEFRYYHTELFWFIEYCRQDPRCYGENILAPRQIGKTKIADCTLFYFTVVGRNKRSGIQSKTDNDAKGVFDKLIYSFRRLPDFLTPKYDTSTKLANDLKLTVPVKRGQNVEYDEEDIGLGGYIDYKNMTELAYDGSTLTGLYLHDEAGKKEGANVWKTLETIKPALEYKSGKGLQIRGHAMFTTTIEPENDISMSYFDILDSSFPHKRDKLGCTPSGLYNWFIPADVVYVLNDYGFADRKESKKLLYAKRDNIKDKDKLFSEMRKNPLSIQEARAISTAGNPFSQEILNNFSKKIHTFVSEPYIRGNFYWIKEFEEVGFSRDDEDGRFYVRWMPNANKQNKVIDSQRSGEKRFSPNNTEIMRGGLDPVAQGGNAVSKTKSSLAFVGYRMNDEYDYPEKSRNFVFDYIYNPIDPQEAYEDVLMASWFYGMGFLVEKQYMLDIYNYFRNRGCANFIKARGKNTYVSFKKNTGEEVGLSASMDTINYWTNLLKKIITEIFKYKDGNNFIPLPRLVNQLIKYTPDLRTRYDLVVAAGYAMIDAEADYEQNIGIDTKAELLKMVYHL